MAVRLLRWGGVAVTATLVLAPISLAAYQSLLSAPFLNPAAHLDLGAYGHVLGDRDFWQALLNTLVLAAAMVLIAVPVGAILAFFVARTDMPGRRWLAPLMLVPVILSPVVIAFGYAVSLGPLGFFSLWTKALAGVVPWNLHSLAGLALVAGLAHAPYVYFYASAALRGIDPRVEEVARTMGASAGNVALGVSLPLIRSALVQGGILVFVLGFALFGLPLVLGDPADIAVLTTYLYKLSNLRGTPPYHLMAVVAVAIMIVTVPLVLLQRRLLGKARRFPALRGQGLAARPLPLGRWKPVALALVLLWLGFTLLVPLAGVFLRSVIWNWGEGVVIWDVLTLSHFAALFEHPDILRGILNTLLIASLGGALALVLYTAIALAGRRGPGRGGAILDDLVSIPRALPGVVAGLAFLWILIVCEPIAPLRDTPASLWIAYTVVWLAFGVGLASSSLMQVAPELEEAARVAGARRNRALRDVTWPLARFGLLGSWLLVFAIFSRDSSIGVFLLGPGTETMGALIVSLWGSGAHDLIAALSLINVLVIGGAFALAVRLGVRAHV